MNDEAERNGERKRGKGRKLVKVSPDGGTGRGGGV